MVVNVSFVHRFVGDGAAVASHATMSGGASNKYGRRAIVGLDKGRDGRHVLVIVQNGLINHQPGQTWVHGSNKKKSRCSVLCCPKGPGFEPQPSWFRILKNPYFVWLAVCTLGEHLVLSAI